MFLPFIKESIRIQPMTRNLLRSKSFLGFLGLYLLFCVSVNLLHPVTTVYVRELNLDSFYFGIFFSAMSLGQVLGSLLWGFLSDKWGRKPFILIGIFGYGLSQLGFGFLNQYPWLPVLFRFLAGVFASAPITLFISSCLSKVHIEERSFALSLASGTQLLGAAFGYEIGGALYEYASLSISTLFIIQPVYCLLLVILFFFIFRDEKKGDTPSNSAKTKGKIQWGFPFVILLLALLAFTIGQVNINKYMDPIVIDRGYSTATLGHYVFLTGIVGALASVFLLPLIQKAKINKLLLLFLSLGGSIVFVLLTYNIPGDLMVMLYTTHLLYILFRAFITPLEQDIFASFGNESTHGAIMGIRQSVCSLGNVFGPLLGSAIYVAGSATIMNVSAAFLGVSLLLFLLFGLVKKK
ncbi:MAG: MFS transporter [Candidatus Enteromonas sp.]|nr:MFS transporter [Candidatus Enteromonas sp.]